MAPSELNTSTFRPTDEWVSRMPSPPRIYVPPPEMSRSFQPPRRDLNSTPSFIVNLDLNDFYAPQDPASWNYTLRRQAQEMLPFLYLGPLVAAKDKEFLTSNGITMVLAVRHSRNPAFMRAGGGLPVANELGIEVRTVNVSNNQGLIAAFSGAISDINHHLFERTIISNGISTTAGKVLVYCESGNERSAALVVAYIMEVLNMALIDTLRLVQGHRFCIAIDDALRHTLRAYEDLLQARRDVYGNSSYVTAPVSTTLSTPIAGEHPGTRMTSKRAFVDDEEMDDMDVTRFEDRTFVPFI